MSMFSFLSVQLRGYEHARGKTRLSRPASQGRAMTSLFGGRESYPSPFHSSPSDGGARARGASTAFRDAATRQFDVRGEGVARARTRALAAQ